MIVYTGHLCDARILKCAMYRGYKPIILKVLVTQLLLLSNDFLVTPSLLLSNGPNRRYSIQ